MRRLFPLIEKMRQLKEAPSPTPDREKVAVENRIIDFLKSQGDYTEDALKKLPHCRY